MPKSGLSNSHPDGFYDLEYAKPITICDGVWLASGVVVNGGVTIGKNSVIGSGSVVTKDIPEGVIAAGVPCRVIRPLSEKDSVKLKKRTFGDDEIFLYKDMN